MTTLPSIGVLRTLASIVTDGVDVFEGGGAGTRDAVKWLLDNDMVGRDDASDLLLTAKGEAFVKHLLDQPIPVARTKWVVLRDDAEDRPGEFDA